MSTESTEPVVATFKKRVRKGAPISKPTVDEPASTDEKPTESAEAVVKRTRTAGPAGLTASNKPTTTTTSAQERSEPDAELLRDLAFDSSKTAAPAGAVDGLATAVNILDGDRAERLEAEQRRAQVQAEARAGGLLGDGVYRGQAGFTQFVENGDKERPKTARRGPQSGSAYTRVACVFDYAMPVCKDWKVSGVCGYGDNCIYLHDRTDYKNGWEMERDYDAAVKAGKDPNAAAADDDKGEFYIGSDDEADGGGAGAGGASTCGICKQTAEAPVETQCGHRFCAKCVKKRVVKGKLGCATCGAATNGLFNSVKADHHS